MSSFPTVFSKDMYCRHVKTRACFGKGFNIFVQFESICFTDFPPLSLEKKKILYKIYFFTTRFQVLMALRSKAFRNIKGKGDKD